MCEAWYIFHQRGTPQMPFTTLSSRPDGMTPDTESNVHPMGSNRVCSLLVALLAIHVVIKNFKPVCTSFFGNAWDPIYFEYFD